jgi:Mg2+ and Co2+ transporter CorA
MHGHLLQADGEVAQATADSITRAVDGSRFFWLDLIDLEDDGVAVLRNTFGFHPLASRMPSISDSGRSSTLTTTSSTSSFMARAMTGMARLKFTSSSPSTTW